MRNHEPAKAIRRARIVDAARALITETGEIGFSMRALAERAGVSLATPYNLFGSKGQIVVELFHDDLVQFERRVAKLRSKSELDRFFDVIALACRAYAEDERFYRTIFIAMFGLSDPEMHGRISPPRQAFWESVVADAAAAGLLVPGTNVRMVATTLIHIVRSTLFAWTFDGMSLARLEGEMAYGFALVLLPVVTPEAAERLRVRIAALDKRLG